MSDSILITGASSGIGRALAINYAAPGVRLVLLGRDEQRMADIADRCRASGAEVVVERVDVRDRDRLRAIIEQNDAAAPINLAIANAGVTTGTPREGEIEPDQESIDAIEINLLGVINTLHPLIPLMIGRGSGQIGIVSSIAGLIPLPDWPSYCASKAAVLSYGQAMRGNLRPRGIGVTVICAGFVQTPMSDRVSGWKPGIVSPDRAAQIIARALTRNRAVVTFPWLLGILARTGSLLPEPLRQLFMPAFRFTVAPATGDTAGNATKQTRSRT